MKKIQVCSNEEARPFQRGDDMETVGKKLQILKIFFFRATGAISNKLGTNHPWVKGIQISSIKEPRLYQRGDNWETVKMN